MRACLKWGRVILAVAVLAGFTLAFLDYRQVLPPRLIHFLASTQFIPSATAFAVGAGLLAVPAAILLLTLLTGRIYCSVLCPLGILQDVIARGAKVFRRKPLRHRPEKRNLRRWILLLTLILAFVGSVGLTWGDPYSHFGRMVSTLLRPLILAANNALVSWMDSSAGIGFYQVTIAWPPPVMLGVVGGFFLMIVIMAALRGRLYCNTLCPVGTMLGFLSERSLLRMKISPDACGKCAECLRACKAQCIDLQNGTVDSSRCVTCFNCLTACDRGAMTWSLSWGKGKSISLSTDLARRTFLWGTAGGLIGAAIALPSSAQASGHDDEDEGKVDAHHERRRAGRVVSPPGSAGFERIEHDCTACQLCVDACSTGVLQPSMLEYGLLHFMKPRMDFSRSFCNYNCTRCTEVCPSGVLQKLELSQKQITRIGVARYEKSHCIVETDGTDCGACAEHCPTQAVHMVSYRDGLFIPEMTPALCIGCGACEHVCPAHPKAILVHGRQHHDLALRSTEGKVSAPAHQDGFPF